MKKTPIPIRLYRNTHNLGIIANFAKAISLCQHDYIALCDQDDVWFDDKLEILARTMRDLEAESLPGTPLLLNTDLVVVDEHLKTIYPSYFEHADNLPSAHPLTLLLTMNYVTGCTCLLNKALKDIILPIPTQVVMHDYWIALVAATFGKIQSIHQPTIYYRQHANNHFGVHVKGQFMKRLHLFTKNLLNLNNHREKLTQLDALVDLLAYTQLEPKQKDLILKTHKQLRKGGIQSLLFLYRNKVLPPRLSRKLSFFFQTFIYRYTG